jgi:hypothetical protein
MQVTRPVMLMCALASGARADDAVEKTGEKTADALDLRLTLSSFLFRETGDATAPLVDNGATIDNASPVRRYFGDLRVELSDDGLVLDGRIRQTTSQRYQSGAGAGGEYELRTLAYGLGGDGTKLVLGRQNVEAVGATKVDGAALIHKLTDSWSGTLFGGAYPALGSRSLDTDYDGLVPVTGGLGVAYATPDLHGDIGLAGVYVVQDVAGATPLEKSRMFATASGYARPAPWLDIYHYALLDVADRAQLTNGSLGITAHPLAAWQLSAQLHHVSTELLEIAARNTLADPDPQAIGIVQNDIAVIRVSQDVARAGTSVALAQNRFELSLSGGLHRRPAVAVALADGGTVAFPEARSADATLVVLDRRSLAGLRASASASLQMPLGGAAPDRARGAVVRVQAGRPFLDDRAELTADVMAERFRDAGRASMCMTSLDPLACFSASRTAAAQAGALASYRVAREWLLLLDTHVGVAHVTSTTMMQPIAYPSVLSVTAFARVQWRYR